MLDTNRDFEQIIGIVEECPAARYKQDGNYYNAKGQMVYVGGEVGKRKQILFKQFQPENRVMYHQTERNREAPSRDDRFENRHILFRKFDIPEVPKIQVMTFKETVKPTLNHMGRNECIWEAGKDFGIHFSQDTTLQEMRKTLKRARREAWYGGPKTLKAMKLQK